MKAKFIEATNSNLNWGKFMVARFTAEEWYEPSAINPEHPLSLLQQIGWDQNLIWVVDLQTREGAAFRPSPNASPQADLTKHTIWVCPLFEPFLGWLYMQDLRDLDALPSKVDIPDAEFAFRGYRRDGEGKPRPIREIERLQEQNAALLEHIRLLKAPPLPQNPEDDSGEAR